MKRLFKQRNFWLMVLMDAALCALAFYLAHGFRFDFAMPETAWQSFKLVVFWAVGIKLIFLYVFGLYRGMWRYTSLHDLINLTKAMGAGSSLLVLFIFFGTRFEGFSRGVYIMDFLLALVFLGAGRLTLRLYFQNVKSQDQGVSSNGDSVPSKRLLIIGAGDGGEKLLREINENPALNYHVVGFLDDNPSKVARRIHGVPVHGGLNNIKEIVHKHRIEQIIIAVPSASAVEMRRFVTFCTTTGLPFKTLPGLGEMVQGKIKVSTIREVRYEDLLGRQEVELNLEEIRHFLNHRRILVTGASGSIGSELCRQIAQFDPAQIILIDKNESGLYDMEMELKAKYPGSIVVPILSHVQGNYIQEVFRLFQPEVVFHAAAYKHVPIMEIFPWEAVFNNIIATQVILSNCLQYGVKNCVVVSTDKAVRPSNIMGASKRVCELLAQSYSQENGCRIMAVRFGNVIGSIGSVVPLFRSQIARGGPVTVTHKDMTRYFMTIPEASRLIIQAGAIGQGGEIFLLQMGTPIRIENIARDMITLSGWVPERDIEIQYVGLRPGEKLHEELISNQEVLEKTSHEKIMVVRSNNHISPERLEEGLLRLAEKAKVGNWQGIREELKRLIPESQI